MILCIIINYKRNPKIKTRVCSRMYKCSAIGMTSNKEIILIQGQISKK
jgi:hypothetical protein